MLMRAQFHRGTYTSHGSIKKGNRKSEVLLRDVEVRGCTLVDVALNGTPQYVATLASLYQKKYAYPKTKIDDSWEKVLLNQCKPIRWILFYTSRSELVLVVHDVLPGSAM